MSKFKPIVDLVSLKGKRALVTGAASGIGKAIVHRFAEAGADLVLVDINLAGLKRVREELSEYGVSVQIYRVDLANKDEIDALWEKVGDIDILVNNAGIYVFKETLEVDENFLDKVMKVNLYGVFWMCQNMIKRRLDSGGVIINVASIEAILPFAKNLVPYDLSKIGVIGLTRALAREYGKYNFRVNALVPGGIETEGVKKLKKKAVLQFRIDMIKTAYNFKSRLPLGRFGLPDEVARVALFLASELSSYVTGALIPVDGGFLST